MSLRKARVSAKGLAGALLAVVGLVALSLVAMLVLMRRAQSAGEETCQHILRLASQGHYDQIGSRGSATPRVIEWLKERDETLGKVRTYRVTRSLAQALGTPWYVHCQVVRQNGTFEETFNGSGRRIFYAAGQDSKTSERTSAP